MLASEKYKYTTDKTFKIYSFISYGPKGAIHKIAKFNELSANTYNFGFGDYDAKTGNISDTVISNNNDTAIIMGTVGNIIYDFTHVFAKAQVVIRGTNIARTRLYQMHINKYWPRIEPVFMIYGLNNEQWESFKTGKNYDAFLGRRKTK